jgi:hypothetical protein
VFVRKLQIVFSLKVPHYLDYHQDAEKDTGEKDRLSCEWRYQNKKRRRRVLRGINPVVGTWMLLEYPETGDINRRWQRHRPASACWAKLCMMCHLINDDLRCTKISERSTRPHSIREYH